MKKFINNLIKVLLPLVLGGAILYVTYRDFDFSSVGKVLFNEMIPGWMLLSLVFEVLSHVCRGLRWKQALSPLGEHPRTANCINAIFISYASSLIIPRIGEVLRCGVLTRYDNVSFSKSLGTVVTERVVDMVCVALIATTALLTQLDTFKSFFQRTGSNLGSIQELLSSTEFYLALATIFALIFIAVVILRKLSFAEKVKSTARNLWEGIISVRKVKNLPLFLFLSFAVWGCYIMQFYLTFYCFGFTEHLGFGVGLSAFVLGSFAVLIPTPNGAGPWHYAIISMLVLYGVSQEDAGIFALLVHGIQTFVMIGLGIYGMLSLLIIGKRKSLTQGEVTNNQAQ